MALDIHVTVELQPSPQLVELLQAMQSGTWQPAGPEPPQIKPQEVQEQSTKLEPKPTPAPERGPLEVIPYFLHSDITTPDFVALEKFSMRLKYGETKDGKLVIKYDTNYIYTTWLDMRRLIESLPNKFKFTGVKLLEDKSPNKSTALRLFIRAVVGGLREGQAAGSQVDPDADFRPVLNQDTHIAKDAGKLEGSLGG